MKKINHKIIIGIVFFGIILNLQAFLLAPYYGTTNVDKYKDIEPDLKTSTFIREDWNDFLRIPLENLTISQEYNLMLDKIFPLQAYWINLNPTIKPSGRDRLAMAYNSECDKVILFGGNDETRDDETWAYDYATNNWTNLNPPTRPSARIVPAMAYDSEQDKVILFGGNDGSYDDETWAYDYVKNNWTNLNPPTRPSARWGHAMVYDSEKDKVILFGGYRAGGQSPQTWAYDYVKNNWINMNPSARPSARHGHVMTYNSEHGKVFLFGGADVTRDDETWAYDYVKNNWTNLNPPTKPGARIYTAMAYDSENDRSILFGGDDGGDDDETWALVTKIYQKGAFKSKIINLYEIYEISGGISWSPENQPVGTNLTLHVGFSNTTNDEDFVYTSKHDSSFTFEGVGRYIRYRVCFESDANLILSPILNSVEMFFVENPISSDDGTPENGNGSPGIPGFDIFILLGIAVAVSVFLIRKRHRSSL